MNYLSIILLIALFITLTIIIKNQPIVISYKNEKKEQEELNNLHNKLLQKSMETDQKWKDFQHLYQSDFDYLLIVSHSIKEMNLNCIDNLVKAAKDRNLEERLYSWLRKNLKPYVYQISGNKKLFDLLYINNHPFGYLEE